MKSLADLVATAAEQERERIRMSEGVMRLENNERHAVWITAGEFYILPAPLLSPAPKEPTIYAVGDNGESGESHSAASSGGYWKATYVPPPEMTFGPAGAILAPTEPEVKP